MKAIEHFKMKTFWCTMLLPVLFLGACKKSDMTDIGNVQTAAVGVVHAAAGMPALDVAFDNNRLNVKYFNYTDRIDYLNAYSGSRNFKIFAATSSSTPLLAKDLSFVNGKYYTVFIVDTSSKMDLVAVRDSSRDAGIDSVRLRFANMSPDAPALDLYAKGNPSPIATNITYKTAGNFFSYRSEANVVFELRTTGQSTLLATMDPLNLYKGNIYTIWCGGYLNGNEAAGTRIRLSSYIH